MNLLHVRGGRPLEGLARPPPDKSITHRALVLAALGSGHTTIAPFAPGADNRSTMQVLRQLGVAITVDGSSAHVSGCGGPAGLVDPDEPLDCGNSGTTMRVMAGVLAASHITATLTGDDSLCRRPMGRLSPLRAMGAGLGGREKDGKLYPPITVRGAAGQLEGANHVLPVASAQVKTALILAGLWAKSPSTIVEPDRSRDHTERMLHALGAPVLTDEAGVIHVSPVGAPWRAEEIEVAPDLSSGAFLLAAALLTGGEEVAVETAVNPTRAGVLDALRAFGALTELEPLEKIGGEPMARVRIRRGPGGLRGTTISGSLTLRAIDEIPLLAAVAAFAAGDTVIAGAEELRVKESDRLTATRELLAAFGAEIEERPDGLVIHGDPSRLHPASVDGGHDHRLAMTAAVVGLALEGCTTVRGAEIIDVSYPGFAAQLASLGADLEDRVGHAVPG